MFCNVNTLPRAAMMSFFMSSRRMPKPRPAMHATTSNLRRSAGRPRRLSSLRCWTLVILSRAVPSSSLSLASMTTWGFSSLGTMKSGA